MTRKMTTILLVVAYLAIAVFVHAAKISEDTVIAEFENENILVKDLNERIENIPAMYRQKYNTPEGKVKLLDMLCTEELFYLEAINEGLDKDSELNMRLIPQLKMLNNEELKKIITKEFEITDKQLNDYYIEHIEEYPAQTFEEAKDLIKLKVRPVFVREYLVQFIEKLLAEHNVKVNEEVIAKIDFEELENNSEILEEKLVTADKEDISLTVGYFVSYYENLRDQGRISLKSEEELLNFINSLRDVNMMNSEAIARGIDKQEDVIVKAEQFKHSMLLRMIYNIKVVEPIDTSDEAAKKYYENNIEEFSSRPFRKIQEFTFEDKKVANDIRKKVKKALKKKDEEMITQLIKDNSLTPAKNGVLGNIYKNNIIPGIGKDEEYSKRIWDMNPKKVSPVFTNAKGVYVFFRILEDNVAISEPFEDIIADIKSKMQRELSKENFENVKAELSEKYDLKQYPERLIVKLDAEEYFNNAETAQKAKRYDDAIYYYDQIIKYYPQTPEEYKALFMKAFLYAEELKDNQKAVTIFEQLLNNYPEGELHNSARFMLDEITDNGSDDIKFED